ncbi:hypothetical protein GCM10017744_000900 [Streptomyces antimycoticus]|uniref:Uncharacterized protein n=1 Tax=Streptomyces antimycoticus TaxID=68175 RepID=A0A4D4KLE5_9ACTN|nr:hypothetical protein SANT12839_098760 [Streptomyces antimycoticus]
MQGAVAERDPPGSYRSPNNNPEGTPIEVFDEIRNGLPTDRSQFYDLSASFYRAYRKGS